MTGLPYISENGEVGHDEVNRVIAGGNYGNPIAEGWAHDPRFLDPVWESEDGRQAPTGAAFYIGTAMPEYTGDFFFCAFNTGNLTRIRLGGPNLDQIAQQEVLSASVAWTWPTRRTARCTWRISPASCASAASRSGQCVVQVRFLHRLEPRRGLKSAATIFGSLRDQERAERRVATTRT